MAQTAALAPEQMLAPYKQEVARSSRAPPITTNTLVAHRYAGAGSGVKAGGANQSRCSSRATTRKASLKLVALA